MALLSPEPFCLFTLESNFGSMNGPFLLDLDIFLLRSAILHNKFIRCLLFISCLSTKCVLTPWRLWILHTNATATFASTVWVRVWMLCDTANCWANTHQAFTTSFSNFTILPILVAYLTDCCKALGIYQADLFRRQC